MFWRKRRTDSTSMPGTSTGRPEAADPFVSEVFAKEIGYIEDRWQHAWPDPTDHPPVAEKHPTTRNNLVGLALSGGGIRSATFNLGLLQALHRFGILRHVDYLSTVSGGGFLGASLSTLMSERSRRGKPEKKADFPFPYSEQASEARTVTYLRNNSNYLTARGALDYLRIFAVLVRGIILNFLVLVPFLLVISMIVTLVYGQDLLTRLEEDQNRQRVDALLEEHWQGMDGEGSVKSLVEKLESERLLATHRGKRAVDVIAALRGQGAAGGAPLISGTGRESSPYRFRSGVTRDQLVQRLWESGTLQNLDALDEIAAIEREVLKRVGRKELSPHSLREVLRRDPQLVRSTAGGGPGEGVEAGSAGDSAAPGAQPGGEDPLLADLSLACSPAPKSTCEPLRGVIVELYERAHFDPAWIAGNVTRPAKADIAAIWPTPLAYWEFVELGEVRAELERSLAPAPTDAKALLDRLCGGSGQPSGLLSRKTCAEGGTEAIQKLYRVIGRSDPLKIRTVLDETARNLYYDRPLDAYDRPLNADWLEDQFLPDRRRQLEQLWQDGRSKRIADGPGANTETASLAGREAEDLRHEPLAYASSLEPIRGVWDPYGVDLRVTYWLGGIALIWILLFPIFLSFRRFVSGLKRGSRWTRRGCLAVLIGASLLLWGLDFALATLALVALAALAYWMVRGVRALQWRDLYERSFSALLALGIGAAIVELQPYLIYHYGHLDLDLSGTIALGAASVVASMAAGPAMALFKKAGKTAVLLVVALLGPILPLLVYIHIVKAVLYWPPAWEGPYQISPWTLVPLFLFGAFVFHLVNLPLDINSTSLHSFYRDRLSKAYLIGHYPKREGGANSQGSGPATRDSIEPEDDISLQEICLEGTGAPLHLFNVALNLQGSTDPAMRRRHSDFFTFSRFHIGGRRTGYCRTEALEQVFPHFYVSSAMAISAAAAAPNMGTFTFGPLVVLMALLNIRLGFWLPSPGRVEQWTRPTTRLRSLVRSVGFAIAAFAGSFRARPGAYFFLREMLSLMHDRSRFVNLSDGGHIENTGAYELLRRRCRFVIIGDAEADPEMKFGGLATLMRYARIDLGIEIEIHVDDLRLDSDGFSHQHCALGVIRYPESGSLPKEEGLLLYVKSSVSGDEDEVVAGYRARHPGFPQESTADQVFDEGQFEAYRGLGFHIGRGLFEDELRPLHTFEDFSGWFQELRTSLSPGVSGELSLAEVHGELATIEEILTDPEFEHYFFEINPDLRPEGYDDARSSEGETLRRVFHLVNLQLQVMQSLLIDLDLDQKGNLNHPANRGWMNLFRRWAQAPTFKRTYLRVFSTYSGRFEQFCDSALGLTLDFRWERLLDRERLRRALATGGGAIPGSGRRKVGRLVVTVAGSGDKLRIANAFLGPNGLEIELRHDFRGTGLHARAELALQRALAGSSPTPRSRQPRG